MRSIRSNAVRSFRASISSEASNPTRSIAARATPCIFCLHRPQPQPQRRLQSTSVAPNAREEPFNTSSTPQQASQTHYTFFPNTLAAGPPPNAPFRINLSALKREFLQLQARAHPDLHPQADKKRAEALSARINEAYKTLQHPLYRAQYLLSLRGIQVAEDETAKVDDPELLMEVLEAREQIEEAEKEEDLMEMRVANEERIEESVRILEDVFERDDLSAAKSEAVKLRYWINIKESIDGWEPGKPVVLQH